MSSNEDAVQVRNAYKHYGPKSGPKHKAVLEGLNMRVKMGTIYSLLGASGCGKTTLLSCVVGRKRLRSGEITILGGSPGDEDLGCRIGYMPQEVALIGEFTVKGAVKFFGKVYGLSDEVIEERFDNLSQLLQLPPNGRAVKECSGGQQRRVSMAAALIHNPELLILDEPTVGLDPIISERIWEHLVYLANNHNVSVIITTHYIEEARHSHTVGLMRGGTLLAEAPPQDLMNTYGKETLEDVFLLLSQKQNENIKSSTAKAIGASEQSIASECDEYVVKHESMIQLTDMRDSREVEKRKKLIKKKSAKEKLDFARVKIYALLFKNILQFLRNPGGTIFSIFFPVLQITSFYFAIGREITGIDVAIVNDEAPLDMCSRLTANDTKIMHDDYGCRSNYLSCLFLKDMGTEMMNPLNYATVEDGFQDTKTGTVVGVLYFPKNFSEGFEKRIEDGIYADNSSLDEGSISVWLDMSNRQIGLTLKSELYKKYQTFSRDVNKGCGRHENISNIPMKMVEQMYTKEDDQYNVFMLSGFVLTIGFFTATTMTSTIMITERLDGVWDRLLVAGIAPFEMLFSHMLTQFTIVCVQTFELLALSFYLYGFYSVGSLWLIFFLMMIEGFCGMCFGFFVSIISVNHSMANIVTTGGFYPMIMISGIIWPIEAMPKILKYVSVATPCTIPISTMRNIMLKGWGFGHETVLTSFGVVFSWVCILNLLSFYFLRAQKI